MTLVRLDGVHLAFAGETVLKDVSLQIRRGDRLGLIGRNGAGKTSLLEIVSGGLKADSGAVVLGRGLRVGYLHQMPELCSDATVFDTALSGRAELLTLRRRLSELQEGAATGDTRVVASLGELQERYEQEGGDDLERRASLALRSVGFDPAQFDQSTSVLSGGERSRLMLAKILVMDADLLLLDEPTNHLDIRGTEFLEEYLSTFQGGALVVTHDRTFLDRFATALVAIEPDCAVGVYSGGYEHYIEVRQERRQRTQKEYEQQKETIERSEEFIRRNVANQKSRQAKSRQKALEKMDILSAPMADDATMGLNFPSVEHSGKVVFHTKDLTLRPGSQVLLDKVSFSIDRSDRVGIIGPNGCGKTTLLKTLLGQMTPERGKVQQGFRCLIGYYDQELSGLSTGRTVLEELSARRPELGEQALRDLAARFLFRGDDVFRRVESFSGGEQSRLALALLVMGKNNVLLLDEPTNHLDIPSREVLEEALLAFPGTVVAVSHDRFFLDRVAKRIFSIEGRSVLVETGVYSELRAAKKIMGEEDSKEEEGFDEEKTRRREAFMQRRKEQRVEESHEKRVLDLESIIHQQEQEIEKLMQAMADPARAFDWEGLEQLQRQKQGIEKEHRANLMEWEQLCARKSREQKKHEDEHPSPKDG
jgi:ATP-binding cassette, subfamily F, member 3